MRAINISSGKGWAIVIWGLPGEEQKDKFIRDIEGQWHYDGLETAEMMH